MVSRDRNESKLNAVLRVSSKDGEQPHEAFVNLRNEPEALEAFTKRWGRLQRPTFENANFKYLWLEHLRAAWRDEPEGIEWVQAILGSEFFTFNATKGRLSMEPKELLGTICILFLRDYSMGRTALCANPDCHSPYFIKKRKTQKFCEAGPCTEQAQREQKREWWRKHYGRAAEEPAKVARRKSR